MRRSLCVAGLIRISQLITMTMFTGIILFADALKRVIPNPSEYEFVPISTMIYDWNSLNQDVPDYEDLLPCNRTIYEDLIEEKSNSQADYEEATGINGSKVIIQYSNPYIQVIKDSRSYDMQSLIGEVGGTLGLLLGFSFVSIFDLLEQIIEGFF